MLLFNFNDDTRNADYYLLNTIKYVAYGMCMNLSNS